MQQLVIKRLLLFPEFLYLVQCHTLKYFRRFSMLLIFLSLCKKFLLFPRDFLSSYSHDSFVVEYAFIGMCVWWFICI